MQLISQKCFSHLIAHIGAIIYYRNDLTVECQLTTIVAVGLTTKGIFRRCANVKVLQRVQKAFNEGTCMCCCFH